MVRYCPNCGAEVGAGQQACPACGATMEGAEGQPRQGQQPQGHQPQGQPRQGQQPQGQPRQGQQPQGHQPQGQPPQGQPPGGRQGGGSGTTRRNLLIGGGVVVAGGAGAWYFLAGPGSGGGGALSDGGTVQGEITMDSPRDPVYNDLAESHTIQASQGDRVTISMRSEAFDTFLAVTGPGGEPVAQDDDGGSDLNSRLTMTVPRDGEYTIWAGSYSGEATGPYTLSVSFQ